MSDIDRLLELERKKSRYDAQPNGIYVDLSPAEELERQSLKSQLESKLEKHDFYKRTAELANELILKMQSQHTNLVKAIQDIRYLLLNKIRIFNLMEIAVYNGNIDDGRVLELREHYKELQNLLESTKEKN